MEAAMSFVHARTKRKVFPSPRTNPGSQPREGGKGGGVKGVAKPHALRLASKPSPLMGSWPTGKAPLVSSNVITIS
jgi:hypothetical protein